MTPRATSSEDPPTTLLPSDLARYESMFEETVLARRRRGRWQGVWSFTPLHNVERIQMSWNDFDKLYDTLGGLETKYRYPSISFNAHKSLGIIEWMPSGVHERMVSSFIGSLAVARESLPNAIAKQVGVVGRQKIGGFAGKYEGSEKEPDVLFRYQESRKIMYTSMVEIGLSETYEHLVDDARLWIEGRRDVKTVILIKVVEDPPYRSPMHKMQDDEIRGFGFPRSYDLGTSKVVLEDQADSFGSLQIRGLTWVGKMCAFLEIWKANTVTGNAERQGVRKYFAGGTDNETAELDIKFSDLYPIDVGAGDVRLPLTWEDLRLDLEEARYELAVLRCGEELDKFGKREESSKDPDHVDEL